MATNLFGRGMDIERVNIVFNYDMPEDSDTYLHRVSDSLEMSAPSWGGDLACLVLRSLSCICGLTLFLSPCRWPVRVALAPKAWLSLLCLMRMMPKSSMMFRTDLK